MKKILLVDDDPDLQKQYSLTLASVGHTVFQAKNASEALNILQTEVPDIIFLDVMMPGEMNGFDLLERLKKDGKMKTIPVIMLTNLDTEKTTALNIGASDYLVKVNTDLKVLNQKVEEYTK